MNPLMMKLGISRRLSQSMVRSKYYPVALNGEWVVTLIIEGKAKTIFGASNRESCQRLIRTLIANTAEQ